jgi:methionine--tRNA ligase beta chain
MELIISNNSHSDAVSLLAAYTRAPINILKLTNAACEHLKVKTPALVSEKLYEFPLSLYNQIARAAGTEHLLAGQDKLEKAQISSWVEAAHTLKVEDLISMVDQQLTYKTYLVTNHITLADIAVLSRIHSTLLSMKFTNDKQLVCLFRWVNHLQSLPGLNKLITKKVDIPNKTSLVPEAFVSSSDAQDGPKPSQPAQEENKQPGAKKAAAPKKAPAPKTQPPKEENKEPEDPVAYLDIRIGLVQNVRRHPGADSLYCEEINLGTETRNVVSGLVHHVSQEDFEGKLVLVLCNLKKSKIRGETSEAMVLCGSHDGKVELLVPPEGSQPGDIVQAQGIKPAPMKQLPPNKKIFENLKPSLGVNSEGVACYRDLPLCTARGIIVAPTLKIGSIS